MNLSLCPCCSNCDYQHCCARFIDDHQLPQSAEELMRSRYTAFTQANMEYIQTTMRGTAAVTSDMDSTRHWAKEVSWQRLEVLKHEPQFAPPARALVEFKAHYRLQGQEHTIHERSLFDLIDGRWFYVGEAPQRAQVQPGRNDACYCGSGKKFKKCCLS